MITIQSGQLGEPIVAPGFEGGAAASNGSFERCGDQPGSVISDSVMIGVS
jgi:hypothetical protein